MMSDQLLFPFRIHHRFLDYSHSTLVYFAVRKIVAAVAERSKNDRALRQEAASIRA
jgi:hypothetical protein